METQRQIGSQLSQCNRAVRTALLGGLKGILLCACALLITPASAAPPETRITSEIFSRCAQLDETTVECDYRQINPRALDGISARVGELELPTPEVFAFPQPGDIAAVLFLIDTSEGRIVGDEEIKNELAALHPYGEWLGAGMVDLDDLPDREHVVCDAPGSFETVCE